MCLDGVADTFRNVPKTFDLYLSAGLGSRNVSSSHGDIAKFRLRPSGLKGLKAQEKRTRDKYEEN